MNNWIFVLTNQKVDDKVFRARDVFEIRMKDGFWGIAEEDYHTIVNRTKGKKIGIIGDDTDIESASEFALEAHLEEFISANWDKVKWGRDISLYTTEANDGRQFPAGSY